MRCAERDKLIDLLTNSVIAYSEAVRSMKGLDGAVLETTREWVRGAHKTCEKYRETLAEHERVHGCASGTTTGSVR